MPGRVGSKGAGAQGWASERSDQPPPDREPLSSVNAGGMGHALFGEGGSFSHVWTERSGREVASLTPPDITGPSVQLLGALLKGDPVHGRGRHLLKFNVSDRYLGKDVAMLGLDAPAAVSTVMAGDRLTVRLETEVDRYNIECCFRPESGRMGDYVLSRLNSKGSASVPELVGFSYWDIDGAPLIWARVVRKGKGSVPALRPMLSDLDALVRRFSAMEGEEFRNSMLELSGEGGTQGLMLAQVLGNQIASMHCDMIVETPDRKEVSGRIGDRIISTLSVSRMTMGDAGSLLGMLGFYMGGLRRELVRLVGDPPTGSKKQKVVKSSPRQDLFRSRGLEALPMLSRRLHAKESEIRRRSSILKGMPGSPMIASLLDTSLERADLRDGKDFVFNSFDWQFSASEGERSKVLPLKDLALSLNSLLKARYLASRRYVREIAQSYGGDPSNLWLMFLEYNMSRPDYDDMRKDVSFRDLVRIKETPFRRIMSVSMVGALWYELAQRNLVKGYVEGLSEKGDGSLLGYPEGTDTLAAIRSLQVLAALSELARTAGSASVSAPTLESDMLIVLTR